MSVVFITGAGTDVGKTFVAAGLIAAWRDAGRSVAAVKPVASGYREDQIAASDPGRLLAALGRPVTAAAAAAIAPWRFAAPLSPDMAARREGRQVDFTALLTFCRASIADHPGDLVIEGIGGIMVPLDERHTVLDWMAGLAVPVVLVAGSLLGSLSHSLSALAVLRQRGLAVAALVVSESADSTVPFDETVAVITRFAGAVPVLGLPRLAAAATHPIFLRLAALLDAAPGAGRH